MTPREIYEILESGSPLQIHEALLNQLDTIAEAFLQETRKAVVAEMFNENFELGETVKRERWNKKSIREGLEKASLMGITEARQWAAPGSAFDHLQNNGFKHVKSHYGDDHISNEFTHPIHGKVTLAKGQFIHHGVKTGSIQKDLVNHLATLKGGE